MMNTLASPPATLTREEPTLTVAQAVIAEVFGPPGGRDFQVWYWDGTTEGPPDDETRFTLILRRPGALRRMFLPPSELAIGEAYLRDDFDVLGDLEAATGLDEEVKAQLRSPIRMARLVQLLRKLPADDIEDGSESRERAGTRSIGRRHSRERDRVAVRAHYDAGNDFYELFLDRGMVYSCAYFEDESCTLERAQEAKLEHICRKLRLRP
jgi:cyclopropane-fatty-acyl-phospholipid synthase